MYFVYHHQLLLYILEIVPSDQNNNHLVKSSNTRTNKGADMQMDVLSDRANLTHTKEEAILTKCSEDKIRQKVNNANHATATSSTINVESTYIKINMSIENFD